MVNNLYYSHYIICWLNLRVTIPVVKYCYMAIADQSYY